LWSLALTGLTVLSEDLADARTHLEQPEMLRQMIYSIFYMDWESKQILMRKSCRKRRFISRINWERFFLAKRSPMKYPLFKGLSIEKQLGCWAEKKIVTVFSGQLCTQPEKR